MKTIQEMAIEAGITPKQIPQPPWINEWCAVKNLEAFAALVREDAIADEREREWVGLNDEDKDEIVRMTERDDRGDVMALVEAKLKEKNT